MFTLPELAKINDPATFWFLAAICAMFVAMAKTGIPGLGILCVGIMANIFKAKESPGILLPMLVAADVFAVLYYRSHAVWKYVLRTLPWAMAGIVAGWATLKFCGLNDVVMRRIIGGIVLGVLVAGYFVGKNKENLRLPNSRLFAAIIGMIGGFTTMAANAAGPIWVIYLLAMRLPKEGYLGTAAFIFLILNTFKLPFSHNLGFITTDSLAFNLKMVPFLALGAIIGRLIAKKIPERGFTIAVKLLAAAAACKLLFT